MTTWGFTLSSEEQPPRRLVELAKQAEAEGFEFVSISDHFHPWVSEQGESPFVWSVIGGVAAATERIGVGTGVTCPIVRIHPAIVAHAVATSTAMLPGRFFFGVGTGEALNEHVLGQRWPNIETRLEMLDEAVAVMRELWKGDSVDFAGTYYTVENARLYTLPDEPPPVIVSAFGKRRPRCAAEIGDGLWSTSPPDSEVLDAYRRPAVRARSTRRSRCAGRPPRTRRRRPRTGSGPTPGAPGSCRRICPRPRTSSRPLARDAGHDRREVPLRTRPGPRRRDRARVRRRPGSTTCTSTRSVPIRKASSGSGGRALEAPLIVGPKGCRGQPPRREAGPHAAEHLTQQTDTCTWLTPMRVAISLWVMPPKNRSATILRSRSGSSWSSERMSMRFSLSSIRRSSPPSVMASSMASSSSSSEPGGTSGVPAIGVAGGEGVEHVLEWYVELGGDLGQGRRSGQPLA